MNSFTSVFKRPALRGLIVFLTSALFLLLLDRGFYRLLSFLAEEFYNQAEVGRDWYGQTQFNRPGFYNTLIAGTSRAKEGIMPLYLYNELGLLAQNNASPGRYPRYHYEHYLKFRSQNGPPSIYIYGLDYFTFAKESNGKQLQGLLGGTRQAKAWKLEEMNNPASPTWSRISHIYRAKKELDAFFVDFLDYLSFRYPVRARGDLNPGGISRYKGLYGTVPPKDRLRPARWQKAAYDPLPGVEGSYFIKLLEALRRDRVLVVLLILPEYIAVHETNYQHDRQRDDLRPLERRFQNVFVLDYNQSGRFELDNPALFADGRWGERISHLSIFGAERLGRMLAEDIRKLQKEWRNRRQ